MGMGAALKLQPVVDNLRRMLAIELLAAAQGIEPRDGRRPRPGGEFLRGEVDKHLDRLE